MNEFKGGSSVHCHFNLSLVQYHWVDEGGKTLRAEALELAAGLT